MLKKSILIWLSIIPLAMLNGILRERLIAPLLGMTYAEPISGVTLCLLIFIVAWIFIPRLGQGPSKIYWTMGLLWVTLTMVFETILGFSMGNTFREILLAYDIRTGNLWSLVVIFICFVPALVAKMKRII